MRIHQLSPRSHRSPTPTRLLLAFSVTALAVAGCGSSTPSASNKSSQTTSKSRTPSSKASVSTTKVPGYGTVLATAHGVAVYLLTADPSGGSSCSGACAKQWPPLTVSGRPTGGSGVNASLLSSFTRSDGSVQVLYGGHALYTHPGTSSTAVAGTASDGGIWYLVSPSGKPIKATTGSGY